MNLGCSQLLGVRSSCVGHHSSPSAACSLPFWYSLGTLAYSVYLIGNCYPLGQSVRTFIGNLVCVNSLNILIVDDSAVLRRSLRNSLQQQPEWIICGEAENGRQGIDKALQLHPNVIVIDLIMPVMNGIEAARVLKRLLPSTPLVMFTTFTDAFLCKEALAAGVDALIPKSEGAEPLIQSIKALASSVPPASAA